MMSDNQPPETFDPHAQRTTNDVRREAEEALKLYAALQKSDINKSESGVFDLSMALRVEVQGSESPVVLLPVNELVLGRLDPASGDIPGFDLSPYAAYQMGISRRHAVIRREMDQLFLVDLGSRNGTFLNGKRLSPHESYKLHDGDEIRLGKMSLRLFFRRKNEG
ncbi:MAG: FHA domain-containing protein [Anaerolineae bacterium]|jgi:hypothetical protein|nr:FHA domain-containing protein [Anaerolineae bacterium]